MRIKHPLRSVLNFVLRRVPLEAQLIVTRRCNLSCGYCSEYDKVSPMIPLQTLRQRIDALHRLRVINITLLGGEPLAHPELPQVVAYGDRRAQVSVTTNGFLLTQELVDRLGEAGLANMVVSVDSVAADPTGYIQKCLKTLEPKLRLLRHAAFDVMVNLVLCEGTKAGFRETVRRLSDLGFPVSIVLQHDASGAVQVGGQDYVDLWTEYYATGTPFSYLEQDYAARLLQGQRPRWKCRAGSRFLYVDEWGNVQFCSAQRGRPDKPLVEYTRRDARVNHGTYKGCEAGCSLLCHYRDSALDNRPLHTLAGAIRQLVRPTRPQRDGVPAFVQGLPRPEG